MADFPLGGGAEGVSIGADLALSRGTIVTSSATPDSKGAWVELEAETTEEINGIAVSIPSLITATSGNDIIIDVGIGGAGNEEEIIQNINVTYGTLSSFSGRHLCLPISIPKGSRIAVRSQASVASQSCTIAMIGLVGSFTSYAPLSFAESLGMDLANTQAHEYDPGAVANTKGAWSEIEASLAHDYAGFSLLLSGNQNSSATDQTGLIDIGIGGAGNEEVILSNVPFKVSSNEFLGSAPCFYNITLPKGQRLSVRVQSTNTQISDRTNGLYFYGVR